MIQKLAFLCGAVLIMALVMLGFAANPGYGAMAAQAPTPTIVMPADPVLGELDLDALSQIDLMDYPIVPEISENALVIYREGLARDNDPHAFAKVGDCMTDTPLFLVPIGEGNYALGEYDHLDRVIEQFSTDDLNSFARKSQAAAGGFNTASIIDSMWANPEFCDAGETPLSCEFRIVQPSIALIMFGTNDVFYLAEDQYNYFLRSTVAETIKNGTLPILSTFPVRPEFPDKSILYNQIVVQIALDFDVPLINLWRALEPLENQGIDLEDTTHLTAPSDGTACHFLSSNLDAGFTVRNLVTLQALDAVLQTVDVAEGN